MTHDAISKTARDQLDAEYESSTQGGNAWWDRYTIRRPGSNPPAPSSEKPPPPPPPPPERSVKGDVPKYDAPMAQRHRFGRVLDKLPFHVSRPPYARAYIRPKTWLNKIVFWFRGWRPFGAWGIWHKPNRRQRLLDRPPDDDDGALTVWLYFSVVVVALVVIWLVAA